MRKTLLTCLTAASLSLGAGPALSAGKLSIYHWFEYIPQELLDKFAAENDVEVTMDTYDSNEALLAALKGGKLGSYDVAVPGDYMVEILAKEGMLDTIADGELANKGQHPAAVGRCFLRSRSPAFHSLISGVPPASP